MVSGRKRGFSIPAAAWLRGPLVPFAREVLSEETLRRQGFFRPETAVRLLDDHVATFLGLDEAWLANADDRAPGLYDVARKVLS